VQQFLQDVWNINMLSLKSHYHSKCFAYQGTFFICEKLAIFLIVVKSSIAAVSNLKVLVWFSSWQWSVIISISLYISEFWKIFAVEKFHRVQESWGEGKVFRALPKLYSWRSPCISSRGNEKHLRVSTVVQCICRKRTAHVAGWKQKEC